jgi:hypothetical protein
MSFVANAVLLFGHLILGSGHVSFLVLDSMLLTTYSGVFAIIAAARKTAGHVTCHTESKNSFFAVDDNNFSALVFFAVGQELLKLLVSMLYGFVSFLSGAELIFNLLFFITLTSVPFWAIDHMPEERSFVYAVGWKIYVVEAADITSMLLGYIQFTDGNSHSVGHGVCAFFYYTACSVVLLGFGAVSANLLGLMFVRSVMEHGDITEVMSMQFKGKTMYRWMCDMVILLDLCSDLPTFIVSACSGAYVGNLGLSLNMLVNVLALGRVTFLYVYSSSVEAREPLGYVRVEDV